MVMWIRLGLATTQYGHPDPRDQQLELDMTEIAGGCLLARSKHVQIQWTAQSHLRTLCPVLRPSLYAFCQLCSSVGDGQRFGAWETAADFPITM